MMMGIPESKGIINVVLVLFLINLPAFASDLIEPTRTLTRSAESSGVLSVFSEPSDLDVRIDGTWIGKTPAANQKVRPGLHAIGVKDVETEIYVKPAESIRLSCFKGTFIEIPAEAKEFQQQQVEAKEESPRTIIPAQPAEKKAKSYPLYWPLNPRGHIY